MNFRVLAASAMAGCLVPTAFAQLSATHPVPQTKAQPHKILVAPDTGTSYQPMVGGGDSCAAADAIAGVGPHAYDNTAATTGAEGQANATCLFFGQTGISNDVWFTWTAGSTGSATLTLCTTATMDSKVAVYTGAGCPGGAPIACNDDSCGLQSQLMFAATNGTQYTIQLGNFPGALPGSGTFSITVAGAATNDDCSAPDVLAGPGPYPYNNSGATTGAEGQANANCLFFGSTGISNDVWFTWTATGTGSATVATCGLASMDSKIAIYTGSGCPGGVAIACNDDSCGLQSSVTFAATSGNVYTIQLGNFPGAAGSTGSFSINIAGPVGACDNHDDGTTENAIGLTAGGNLMWLQRFGAPATSTTVTQISTAYGSPINPPTGNPTNGAAVTVAIYSDLDNDGNPTNAVLLQTVAGAIAGSGTDAFQTFNLAPAVTVNGHIWAGVSIANPAGQFPAPLDQNVNASFAGQAWITGQTGGGPLNLANLGANNVAPLDIATAGFPGQWLLRVTCGAGGSPGSDFCLPHGAGGCPCSNPGDVGHGCGSGSNPAGAILSSAGAATLTADTVVLTASGEKPNVLNIFLQGTAQIPGAAFGQGLICTGGSTVRLYSKNADGSGTAVAPTGAELSVSAQSALLGDIITPGATRFYQTYYRDPRVLAGCSPADTFNITQGQSILWN